jgi:hypothetical protein
MLEIIRINMVNLIKKYDIYHKKKRVLIIIDLKNKLRNRFKKILKLYRKK